MSRISRWWNYHKINTKESIAYFLDKFDRWCWTDLVCWAHYNKPFRELDKIGYCEKSQQPYGYCGKCKYEVGNGGA